MPTSDRVRDALSTLADYTLGTVIAMVQLAMADREGFRPRPGASERAARDRRDRGSA